MRYRNEHREVQIENTAPLACSLPLYLGRVGEPLRLIILRNFAHFVDAYWQQGYLR